MEKLTSRKLWVAVGAILVAVGGALQGAIPPDEAIAKVVQVAFAYLAAEGVADAVGAARQ